MGGAGIDYLDAFQVTLCTIFIVALSYLLGIFKMFGTKHATEIRRALYLIVIPGFIFRQIGKRPLDKYSWQPFFNGILVQLSYHLILIFICYLFPFKNKSKKFMEICYSTSCVNFLYFSCPVIQFIYGINYIYIPVFQSLVQFLFLIPLYTVLDYFFVNPNQPSLEQNYFDSSSEHSEVNIANEISAFGEENTADKKIEEDDESIELEEGIEVGPAQPVIPIETVEDEFDNDHEEDPESINLESSEKSKTTNKKSPKKTKTSKKPKKDKNNNENNEVKNENKDAKNNTPSVNNHNNEEKSSSDSKVSLNSALLWTICTPTNVCMIIGIIWSATKWQMITFIEEFTLDLQKAVFGAGLFIVGLFMSDHKWFGFDIPKVLLFLGIHYIVLPLLSLFWSYILKLDKSTSIINVISHVAPVAIFGPVMATSSGYKLKSVSFSFFWSTVIFLPMAMLWIIIFNEIPMFDDNVI